MDINEIINRSLKKEIKRVIEESVAHANCFGIPRGLEKYRKNERENIMIVENCGVAAYSYREVLNYITQLVQYRITNEIYDDIIVDINRGHQLIDLSESFVLIIQFLNQDETATYLDEKTVVRNGVAKQVYIYLVVNPFNHNNSLFSQFLYHEINHCKEDIKRQIKNNDSLNDILEGDKAKIKYQDVYYNTSKDNIATLYIIYLLIQS